MAYNPFNIFRRNQRAIFAVVTVFIMFTFVLSSGLQGGADFFDWLPAFVRGKAKKGDAICSIDGSRLYERDLYQLRTQRAMASKFMLYAAAQTVNNLHQTFSEQLAQGTPQFRDMLQRAFLDPRAMQEQWMRSILHQMIESSPNAKQADKEALRTLDVVTALRQSGQLAGYTGTYFANAPNRTDRDRVDFILWDHKAKALGIGFGKEDVKALIQREFMGQFKSDVEVRQALEKEIPGFSLDACLAALGVEFRVRTAQNALLGDSDPLAGATGRGALPPGRTLNVFDPSFDLFEYYREKTSPTAYETLAVPAANFSGQVPAPTEDELKRLFNERKDYEPDPAKEEPGFREPRKVKVDWVSATGDEKYYQDAARAWVARAEQFGRSELWGLTVPVPGMGAGAWGAIAAGPMAAKEPLVYDLYQNRVVANFKNQVMLRWDSPSSLLTRSSLLDTSFVRPQTLAAAAGGGAGLAAGFAPASLPLDLFYAAAVSGEQRARVKAGLPLVLGEIPGPGLLATAVGGAAAYQAAQPAPLPLGAVKPELLKEMTEKKARELAIADLRKLKEEVEKLTDNGKAKDKSAARAYIADFVKTRGLKSGGSAEPHSEWTIGEDPGLAPLKAVKDKGADGADPHGNLQAPVAFGRKFFWTTNPRTGGRDVVTGTYQPEFYPERAPEATPSPFGKPEPVFLAWRAEEIPAKGLAFQAARPRVVEAWKLLKARDLAKAEADRLANEIRAKPATSDFQITQNMADLRAQLQNRAADPKARDRVKLFRIENVAPVQIVPVITSAGSDTVRDFQLLPTADLPYPTPDMAKALIEERTKPVKTVLVQPDQPKDTYYVFVLLKRDERSPGEFQRTFGGLAPSQVAEQIRQRFIRDAKFKARDSVLGLIKKEFRFEETEEQKKKLDERDKKGEE